MKEDKFLKSGIPPDVTNAVEPKGRAPDNTLSVESGVPSGEASSAENSAPPGKTSSVESAASSVEASSAENSGTSGGASAAGNGVPSVEAPSAKNSGTSGGASAAGNGVPSVEAPSAENSGTSGGAPPGKRGGKDPGGAGVLLTEFLYLLAKLAVVGLAFFLTFTLIFGVTRVEDASMTPAVKDGDLVIYYRLDKNYAASDTLVLEYQGHKQVRRVIGVEGDVVDITEDGLLLNGTRQSELQIYEETLRYDTGVDFPLTVGEGQVFVLGDARENATDSRVYGLVNVEDTLGKVMTVVRRRGI